ncbi:MAG: transporter associated domain-containing protein, partial [Reichenbachiella sp.]
RKTRHTRFPLCEGSLDQIKGVVHIKDLLGVNVEDSNELIKLARPAVFVPETLSISALLQEFRNLKQHFAFVEDEYGTVIGIVTLENVIEELVGAVQDEFDEEQAPIIEESEGKYLVNGSLSINYLNEHLNLDLEANEADSLSGLLLEQAGIHLTKGQKIRLNDGTVAEIINLKHRRVIKARLNILNEHAGLE